MPALSSLNYAIYVAKDFTDDLCHPAPSGTFPQAPVKKADNIRRLAKIFATYAVTPLRVETAPEPWKCPRDYSEPVTREDPPQALRVAPPPEVSTEEPTIAPRMISAT